MHYSLYLNTFGQSADGFCSKKKKKPREREDTACFLTDRIVLQYLNFEIY